MQLYIRHETRYLYTEPVKRSVQTLRLTPRRDATQRTLSWQLIAPGRQHAQVDAHGNLNHLLTLVEPHEEIRIVATGIVETLPGEAGLAADERAYSVLPYITSTPLTRADEALHAYASENLAQGADRSALLRFAGAVRERINYQPGTSEVSDTANDAFASERGVCQDQAHVFLAACRSVGIPARYVSGYLYTGDAEHIASHAWVDAWVAPEQRWLGIDVTNGEIAGEKLCRLAVGRDYLDACPVRGVRTGGGQERMKAGVVVASSIADQ